MAQHALMSVFARAHSKAYCVGGRFELASITFPLELPTADKLGPQAHKSKINHNNK